MILYSRCFRYYFVALEDIEMSYEKVAQVQSRITSGVKQTLKAMKSNLVSEVYIAEDADQAITYKVVELAKELGITLRYVDSMKKLGLACGIDVGASTVAIKHA